MREPIVFDKQNCCKSNCPVGYIYKITNKITGDYYIGKHCYNKPHLDNSYWGGGTKHLQDAYKFYGKENFTREILYWSYDSELDLFEKEERYIDAFHSYVASNHYNESPGGIGFTSEQMSGENNPYYGKGYLLTGDNNPNFGKRRDESWKQNHSKLIKNKMKKPEVSSKLRNSALDRLKDPEYKKELIDRILPYVRRGSENPSSRSCVQFTS